jgi:hypothetical protein
VRQLILYLACIVGLGGPLWLAQIAPPIGSARVRHPYRWGAWVSLQTALISGGAVATSFLIVASRGIEALAFLLMALGTLGLLSSVILYLRKRVGVVLTIAAEIVFLITAIVLGPVQRPGQLLWMAPSILLALILLANSLYFLKRWKLMAPWHEPPKDSGKKPAPRRRLGRLVIPRLKTRQAR